tara:strand:- start:5008 stop:5274 length:267 start_codon:yes stop_codon:yes gene_type:complete
MLWCCGATLIALAVVPAMACDLDLWDACPTHALHTNPYVLGVAGLGLVIVAADKAVHKVARTIACLPCAATRACRRCLCPEGEQRRVI